MIQETQFKALIPDVKWTYASSYLSLFETVLPNNQIDTPLRKAHFLAQVTHESGGFRAVKENLNYSGTALYQVFRKYFPNKDLAEQYARQPEKIANRVYANRMGNADEASGDGYRYRGRGLIQLTGKEKYIKYGAKAGIDAVSNPDLLLQPEHALASACWFWNDLNLNRYADTDDVVMVTKRINGGTNGLPDREHFLTEYKQLFGV